MFGLAAADAPDSPPATISAEVQRVRGLGFSAGFSSGVGLHYRAFMPDGWGYGATLGYGWYFADASGIYSAALEAMKTIFIADWGRFYYVGALHRSQAIGRNAAPTSAVTLFGPGLGIDFGPAEGVRVALEVPFTIYIEGTNKVGWALPVPNLVVTYQY